MAQVVHLPLGVAPAADIDAFALAGRRQQTGLADFVLRGPVGRAVQVGSGLVAPAPQRQPHDVEREGAQGGGARVGVDLLEKGGVGGVAPGGPHEPLPRRVEVADQGRAELGVIAKAPGDALRRCHLDQH